MAGPNILDGLGVASDDIQTEFAKDFYRNRIESLTDELNADPSNERLINEIIQLKENLNNLRTDPIEENAFQDFINDELIARQWFDADSAHHINANGVPFTDAERDAIFSTAVENAVGSVSGMNPGRGRILDEVDKIIAEIANGTRDVPTRIFHDGIEECFLAGTLISMADGSQKQIEEITPQEEVLSYNKAGQLVPSKVTRTFQNQAKHILDIFGLMVTPGHVTLCGDGKFLGQHVPMIDILCSDGALVREDGSKIRASTNCDLNSAGDQMLWVVTGEKNADGTIEIAESARIRAGTRFIMETGHDVSIIELIQANGGYISEDGYVGSSDNSEKQPFYWNFSSSLPKPEDYILQRSALHLDEIYQVAEWESVKPQVPAPNMGDMGRVEKLSEPILQAVPPNVPHSIRGTADEPVMNRKQRRLYNARKRKAKSVSKRQSVH